MDNVTKSLKVSKTNANTKNKKVKTKAKITETKITDLPKKTVNKIAFTECHSVEKL